MFKLGGHNRERSLSNIRPQVNPFNPVRPSVVIKIKIHDIGVLYISIFSYFQRERTGRVVIILCEIQRHWALVGWRDLWVAGSKGDCQKYEENTRLPSTQVCSLDS